MVDSLKVTVESDLSDLEKVKRGLKEVTDKKYEVEFQVDADKMRSHLALLKGDLKKTAKELSEDFDIDPDLIDMDAHRKNTKEMIRQTESDLKDLENGFSKHKQRQDKTSKYFHEKDLQRAARKSAAIRNLSQEDYERDFKRKLLDKEKAEYGSGMRGQKEGVHFNDYDSAMSRDADRPTGRRSISGGGTGYVGGTRRGGLSGGGGRTGYLSQMPQNPLLGRLAQFGMMASGMAATMFLMQMISAKLQELSSIITTWNESVLSIIDSTNLVAMDMQMVSDGLRGYSRSLGISGTGIQEAVTAAVQSGIKPTKENVEKLYGLQMSGLVKNYKEAALIMTMAGTEFGDNAAKRSIEKWNAYSGQGKDHGTVGFEGGKLKTAAIGALIESWDRHANDFSMTLRKISDWVDLNRYSIANFFEIAVDGAVKFVTALKTIGPPLLLIAGIWSGSMLTKLGLDVFRNLGVMLTNLLPTISLVAKELRGLQLIMYGFVPAIAAIGVAFLASELLKLGAAGKKSAKLFQDATNVTKGAAAEMSEAQRDQLKSQLQDRIEHLKKFKAEAKTTSEKIAFALGGKKYKEDTLRLRTENNIKQLKKLQTALDDLNKIEAKNILEGALSSEQALSNHISALEKINKEFEYMNDELAAIKKAQLALTFQEDITNLGLDIATAKNSVESFKLSLEADSDKKRIFEVTLAAASRLNNGFSATEKKIFLFKESLKELKQTSPGAAGAIKVLEDIIRNLDFKEGTAQVVALGNAIHALKLSASQFNMTPMEKKIDDFNRKFSGKGNPAAEAIGRERTREIGRLQIAKEWEKSTTPGYDIKEHQKNVDSTFKTEPGVQLSRENEQVYKNISKLNKLKTDELAINARLTAEKAKGFTVATNAQIILEAQLKSKETEIRLHKNLISLNTAQKINENTSATKEYSIAINQLNRELQIAQIGSNTLGYTSDTEVEKRIAIRKLSVQREFKLQGISLEGKAYAAKMENIWFEESAKAQKEKLAHYQAEDTAIDRLVSEKTLKAKADLYEIENTRILDKDLLKLIQSEQKYQLALEGRHNLKLGADIKVGLQQSAKTMRSEYMTTGEMIQNTLKTATDSLSSALHSLVMGTKSVKEAFSDMAVSILSDLASMIIKQEIYNMLIGSDYASGKSSSYGGLIGAVVNGLFSSYAHGGVVTGINKYSNQIVSQPTLVPAAYGITSYASGGALFGEAGAEAIMPLTRTTDGNLGVRVETEKENKTMNVTQNFMISGSDAKTVTQKSQRQIAASAQRGLRQASMLA